MAGAGLTPQIVIELPAPASPAVIAAAERMHMRVSHQLRRLARESHLQNAPGWLDEDPPTWRFLGPSPAWRPFDWAIDS